MLNNRILFKNFQVILITILISVIFFNNKNYVELANTTQQIEESISFELSKDNIKLKLFNGQILIGNRKLVNYWSKYSIKTKIVYEFLGIPFAQAPINEKRFQFPYRLNKLLPNDTYNATYFRPSCMQEYDNTFPGFRGSEMWNPAHGVSEDCLYLNVWIPVTNEQDNLLYQKDTLIYRPDAFKDKITSPKTSIFWIYGGSFNSGSANLNITDGTILSSSENLIVITANYRTGPFGFLYLNSSSSPGNAGLADQVMAIEWFRENYIDYFGGSNSSFSLFGESAGSMSIHFLLLTNKSDLFNTAIFQSISAYLDISYRSADEAFKVSLSFAEKCGCLEINNNKINKSDENSLKLKENKLNKSEKLINESDLKELSSVIFKCLLSLNASYLSQKQFEIDYVNEHLKMQFIPTSDYHKFLNIDPLDYDFRQYKQKFTNHSILLGINQDESTYFTFYSYYDVYFNRDDFLKKNEKYDNKFVINRLAESLKTKTASNQILSSVDLQKKIPILNITVISDENSDKINSYFYQKYVDCISNIYTYKTNYYTDSSGVELNFNLDYNYKNSPFLAWKKFNKILSDDMYICTTVHLANKFSEINPNTYFYKFNKRNKKNPWPEWFGVIHGYEIEYIFGVPWLEKDLFDNEDRYMSRKIMNFWGNFAKYGKLFSIYDTVGNREYYVDLGPVNQVKNLTELEEYDLFNKFSTNCNLFNQLNKRQTYASKYEQCLKYQEPSNSGILLNSSFSQFKFCFYFHIIKIFLLFTIILVTFF